MKALLGFALRILSLRLGVILLSLAQTTLWAATLGMEGFGLISTYLSAQIIASLLGRFGADNVLVRNFKQDPEFHARFPGFVQASVLASIAFAGLAVFLLSVLVFRTWPVQGAVVFVCFVVVFNLSQILSRIMLAQERQVLVSLVGGVLPVAISVGLFWTATATGALPHVSIPTHVAALGFLALGHLCAVLVCFLLLLKFWAECLAAARQSGIRYCLLLGREQWYFIGYQGMGMARNQGMILVVAAVFGPAVTGVFALANRFGSLLTYLNEPARMYVMPRVAGKTRRQLAGLYRRMLAMNAGFAVVGSGALFALYALVELPFSTYPPFALFTSIIMASAAINLMVGPVGAILAMSGHEKYNFVAHMSGLFTAAVFLTAVYVFRMPLMAVFAVAASSVMINVVNSFSLVGLLRRPEEQT